MPSIFAPRGVGAPPGGSGEGYGAVGRAPSGVPGTGSVGSMPADRVLGWAVGAGLAVGLLASGVVVASGVLDRPEEVRGDEAVAELLQAWAANRLGTYVVEGESVRRGTDGDELRSDVRIVQRPPDRVTVQFGGVEGTVDGRPLGCTTGPSAEVLCGSGAEQLPEDAYEQGVQAEVDRMLGYLVGDPPLYRVAGDGEGCFDLEQARTYPLVPYGSSARFCFDEQTGALTFARQEHEHLVDTFTATSVRGEVDDADLDVSEQLEG